MTETSLDPTTRGATLAPAAALVLLACVAYVPAFWAGFIWDDDAYVTANRALRDLDGLRRIWVEPTASPQYYPLVFTTFWVEHRLWGLNPFGYHLTNVLLHGLNGVLLWRVLRALGVPAPWFAAAVFVLHPVHVESVAWVTERKNVLSGFFYLAAALAYFRFAPPQQPAAPAGSRWGWYALAVVLFIAALLSKTVTCTLPAALLLVLWWKRPRLTVRDLAALVPLFALGVALALVTVWLEKHHVGAKGQDWHLSPVDRVLVAGRALCFYAVSLVFPVRLAFIYPRWVIDAGAAWQYLYPAAVIAVPALCWSLRDKWGRGPLVALLYFAGTLSPALGLIDFYPMRFSFVADHFQYLASIGVIALVSGVAANAVWRSAATDPLIPRAIGAVTLLVLGALTAAQSTIYADLPTLWADTLAKSPDCWMAHNNLGELLIQQRKYREAQRHYQEAVRLKPDDPTHHYNLGKSLWFQGRVNEAVPWYREAVRLDPDFAEAHFNLGLALRQQEKLDEAIQHFREAVRGRPRFAQAHNNLGVALAMQGKHEAAIPHFQASADAEPNEPGTYFNLALAHAKCKRLDRAIEFARRATELAPNDPRFRQLLDGLLTEAKGEP